ncbi:MAG: hypothetical protein ACRDHU_14390 [Actinomycetota bacterium]
MPETGTGSARRPPQTNAPPPPDASEGETRTLVCNVAFCPICMAVTAAQGAAPDAVEHLLKAAREFFLAARAVIDVRGDHLEGERGSKRATFEKIDIA